MAIPAFSYDYEGEAVLGRALYLTRSSFFYAMAMDNNKIIIKNNDEQERKI